MNAALELALRLIRAFEGCRLRAYLDSVHIWTVCYGFIRGVTADTVKTQSECEALLASEHFDAVAVELDTRAPIPGRRQEDEALWSEYARKREHLERLGITVVHITPRKLREAIDQQATVVRTALMASGDREPAAYVVVLPR